MQPQPRSSLQTFTPIIGAFFALAAVAAAFTHDFATASAFACVGAAFLLFWRETRSWADLPRWKRMTTLLLILLGAIALVISFIYSPGK